MSIQAIRNAALKLKGQRTSQPFGESEPISDVPRRVMKEDKLLKERLSQKKTPSSLSTEDDDYSKCRIDDPLEAYGELDFERRMDIRRLR